MKVYRAGEFRGTHPWDALPIERFETATVRLHWTDRPYVWHVNDGPEVFVVLQGKVEMRTRRDGVETLFTLGAGDVFHAEAGDEHVAHPDGEARVLVVEREGSV